MALDGDRTQMEGGMRQDWEATSMARYLKESILCSLCRPFWLILCMHRQTLRKHYGLFWLLPYPKNISCFSPPYHVKLEPTSTKDLCNPAPTSLLAVIFHCWEIITVFESRAFRVTQPAWILFLPRPTFVTQDRLLNLAEPVFSYL